MLSFAALVIGTVVALWFVVWMWRILGAIAGVETAIISIVVIVSVAWIYGVLPPLFGLMATSPIVIVAGVISFILLRVVI
ncbi:hypothetical protein SAMN05421752_1303 [Natronorubrum thiooxidans]|uniref:Uncharacterized protein n=1 Tax=Natronorubrum thiooxidans TaxID=308853 RepID=A0A1N7H7M6_9EURY|nr:hypothetical protein SAMN05421752_1303 [Natronorubrum thiooxidans]